MLSELPNLFDRNFAVGFVLPAILILFGSYLVLWAFELRPQWMPFHELTIAEEPKITDALVVSGVVWVTAIALLAINRPYIRFLEGYGGKSNPLNLWLGERATRCFDLHVDPTLKLQKEIENARKDGTEPDVTEEHATKLRQAVEQYPDEKAWVLPTKFGNRYRAIEVYSRVVYGLEAVVAWDRLEALMPENFRNNLAGAKAQMDFAVNLMLASFLVLAVYITLAAANRSLPAVWLPAGLILILIFGYSTALSSLTIYGNHVKSAFDLFRSELANGLGLELPRSASEEREMWRDASRMMTYRSSDAWDRLEKYRKGKSPSNTAA